MQNQPNLTQVSPQSTRLSPEWVERLMLRFTSRYGHKFTSQITSEEQRLDWLETWAIDLAGMSAAQIKTALELSADKFTAWPPTSLEFKQLIHKPIDYQRMFLDAANGDFKTKVTYWSAQSFGMYDIRRLEYKTAKERWIKIVDEMAGNHTLPNIPDNKPALPAPGKTTTPEVAARGIAAAKSSKSGKGCRDWAKWPHSQKAVDLMFSFPPMTEEIEIATKAGYIIGDQWIPEGKRVPIVDEPEREIV